jgi:hypothetical protein
MLKRVTPRDQVYRRVFLDIHLLQELGKHGILSTAHTGADD